MLGQLPKRGAVYLITAVGVTATDLLTGVGLGMAAAVLLMMWRLARCEIRTTQPAPDTWLVSISGTLTFIASGRLTRRLAALPAAQQVKVELHLDYLDHGAYETLRDWQQSYTRTGGHVHISEIHDSWFHRATSDRLGAGKSTPRQLRPRS